MSCDGDWVINVQRVSKCYKLYQDPGDRFKEFFMPLVHEWCPLLGQATYAQDFWSLKEITFQLKKGEVLGLIGVNGAGKSSLLQLICGVLQPTSGVVSVKGRIAAILELGAGFNPEFTGRENIGLNATLLGLTPQEIRDKTPEIIAFSGVQAFIDQPVKTYSSGMYVRLAFAIATSVDPDILVIDEALSVGDGAFARKSFDKIMELKAKGVTILFCSHSIYQVQALCQKAIWLHKGQVQAQGPSSEVAMAYNEFLDRLGEVDSDSSLNASQLNGQVLESARALGVLDKKEPKSPWEEVRLKESPLDATSTQVTQRFGESSRSARLEQIKILVDGLDVFPRVLQSMSSELELNIQFSASLSLPTPNVGVVISDSNGKNISSCSNFYDGLTLNRNAQGVGSLRLRFPRIHLLRGRFMVKVFLLCENAMLIYDSAMVGEFEVVQPGLELGVVALHREWVLS